MPKPNDQSLPRRLWMGALVVSVVITLLGFADKPNALAQTGARPSSPPCHAEALIIIKCGFHKQPINLASECHAFQSAGGYFYNCAEPVLPKGRTIDLPVRVMVDFPDPGNRECLNPKLAIQRQAMFSLSERSDGAATASVDAVSTDSSMGMHGCGNIIDGMAHIQLSPTIDMEKIPALQFQVTANYDYCEGPCDKKKHKSTISFDYDTGMTSTQFTIQLVPGVAHVKPPARRPLIFVLAVMGSELQAIRGASGVCGYKSSVPLSSGQSVIDSYGNTICVNYFSREPVWINTGWLIASAENINVLRFHDVLRAGSVVAEPLFDDFASDGQPLFTKGAGYPDVEGFFKEHGYTLGKDFFFYAYDWRYDAARAAAGLDRFIGEKIQGAQVDIIAHSMGTLVTRKFLLTGNRNAGKVHKVVFLAGPHLGTPQGAQAVFIGFPLPDYGNALVGIPSHTFQYFSKTMPGTLDLTPSQSYFKIFQDQDSQHISPFIDFRGGVASSYAALRAAEKRSGVAESVITPGETLHETDLSWPKVIGNKVTLFSGVGQCTIGQISVKSHYNLTNPSAPPQDVWDFQMINGDGTVTRGSSSMDNGKAGGRNLPVYYRGPYTHNQMGDDTVVLSDALKVLQGNSPTDHGDHLKDSFSCKTISVHGSSVEVQLIDKKNRRIGGFSKENFNEVPNASFLRSENLKIATIRSGDPFTIAIHGAGTGESTIKVRTWGTQGLVSETDFLSFKASSRTVGSFALKGGSVSNLRLDVNGDGRNVRALRATQLRLSKIVPVVR